MISLKNIQKKYGALSVLNGIDLEIAKGEIVSIVGSSGAGKTTLLQILGTLDKPDSGSVHYQETNPFTLSDSGLARFRNQHIGFVFQFHHLLPEFDAFENVCIPGYLGEYVKKEVEDRAVFLLEKLGLKDRLKHKPSELSGGEQQRVAVARALINNPSVILADEPSGNLDTANAEFLHQLFFDLRDSFEQTFVIVTHNMELAKMSDRLITLKDGLVV